MKNLNGTKDLDTIKVGDKRKVYDFNCICTFKSNDFAIFHTYLKNNKIGKKNTSFLKLNYEHINGYEWKNINNHTSTKFVNQ